MRSLKERGMNTTLAYPSDIVDDWILVLYKSLDNNTVASGQRSPPQTPVVCPLASARAVVRDTAHWSPVPRSPQGTRRSREPPKVTRSMKRSDVSLVRSEPCLGRMVWCNRWKAVMWYQVVRIPQFSAAH
jgi:hypothetical protein